MVNISFLWANAKGKIGKNEKKFDNYQLLYIISQVVGITRLFGDVAQLVEQRPFKAKVPGSSPGISTM
jgi:hypothetical protein